MEEQRESKRAEFFSKSLLTKTNFVDKFRKSILTSMRIFLVVLSVASGYAISEIHHRYKESQIQEAGSPMVTRTSSEISVAINERNELMLIDRRNGKYEIYQDSTGMQIFNLYANKLYKDNNQ